MDALILAAGYATRLYPLTLTQAKPLLPVGGKPMIDHVLEKLDKIVGLERVYVISNHKFADLFTAWAATTKATSRPITILDDGSTSPENALGAIGDLRFVLQKTGLKNDLIVAAGDNLFSESLAGFGAEGRKRNAPVLGLYDVGDRELIKKYNNISVNAEGQITHFEEKPKEPTSTMTGVALYYYPAHVLPLVDKYVAEGNNADQPGRFVQWLYPQTPVYTWTVPGVWFDIGGKEQLEEADQTFPRSA